MSLWDFHPNFTIAGSKNGVFIQLNPRLCPYTIDPLVKDVLKRNYSDRSVDVSKTTNGNSITCTYSRLIVENFLLVAKKLFMFFRIIII